MRIPSNHCPRTLGRYRVVPGRSPPDCWSSWACARTRRSAGCAMPAGPVPLKHRPRKPMCWGVCRKRLPTHPGRWRASGTGRSGPSWVWRWATALAPRSSFSPRDAQPRLVDMVGGGPFALTPGAWTDDTAMALALADSLATSLPGQLVDLRRVQVGLEDGSWGARRPQRAPPPAAGAGRD